MPSRRIRLLAISAGVLLFAFSEACSGSTSPVVLTADMPLHLEDHLDAATFTEAAATDSPKTELRKPVEWRFDQPRSLGYIR